MNEAKRETVGSIVQKIAEQPLVYVSAIELGREGTKNHLEQILWAVKHAQKKVDCSTMPCQNSCKEHIKPIPNCYSLSCADYCKQRDAYLGDVFVELILKNESALHNTPKTQFAWRTTCPAPFFDQSVFWYKAKTEELEYLWTIPDKERCLIMLSNAKDVVPEEQWLLSFIVKFGNGDLYKVMKAINGERKDSYLLDK